jgi:hypothetical protein
MVGVFCVGQFGLRLLLLDPSNPFWTLLVYAPEMVLLNTTKPRSSHVFVSQYLAYMLQADYPSKPRCGGHLSS